MSSWRRRSPASSASWGATGPDLASATPPRERAASIQAALTDGASLRSWTAVANDGIIATAGILEGFAGAGASDQALLVAATVATITGMLAAGGAKWAEIDAEREAQLRAAADPLADLAAGDDHDVGGWFLDSQAASRAHYCDDADHGHLSGAG